MTSAKDHDERAATAAMVIAFRKQGIRLWTHEHRLHYRSINRALTHDELEALKLHKDSIIALLDTGNPPQPKENVETAPLTYSQLAHWHLYGLRDRPSFCQLLSLTRLQGHLQIEVLQRSLSEMLVRHDALRTRIVETDGVPIQQIIGSADCPLDLIDLAPRGRRMSDAELTSVVEQLAIAPIDVRVSPMLNVHLLRIHEEDHILLIALEHSIADGVSVGILLRDLFNAYSQAKRQQPPLLPKIPAQFSDYAVWQAGDERQWLDKHGPYWRDCLGRYRRLSFPSDTTQCPTGLSGWDDRPFHFRPGTKEALVEWCRHRKTTIVLAVFTAYVAVVLRWCHSYHGLFPYQTDGRARPEFEHTVGYFSSVLYVPVELKPCDTFVSLLDHVTRGYCEAYEHADSSYHEARTPRPEFTRNSCFNWISHRPNIDNVEVASLRGELTCSPLYIAPRLLHHIDTDLEPTTIFVESDNAIFGVVQFPADRIAKETMARFARSLISFVEILLRTPQQRISTAVLAN